MVGIVECDEAFGVFGGQEYLGCILYAHNRISRGVQHQQGGFQIATDDVADLREQVLHLAVALEVLGFHFEHIGGHQAGQL